MKRKRRVFQTSEPAYRAFLNKFSENKKFNDACIVPALNYAFSKTFKSNIPSDTRSHLVKVILASREKILNDLHILKDSPDSKIQPLGRKQKLSNDDDTGKTTKRRKLNNDGISHKKTIITCDSKENYSNKQSSNRNLTRNKNSKINFQRDKILKVTIENDKNLQDMAKSFTNENEENQNQSSEINTDKTNSNQQLADKNQKENENMNVTKDQNKSIEIEQSFLRVNGNDDPFRVESVCIKKEIDLLDDSLQGDIPIPLPEGPEDVCAVAASNNAFSLEADNQSNVANNPLVSVNSQENVSSLNIACYNNFIPPVQPFSNFNQMPHTNSCPCMFLHHHMIMSSHYGCYHGMYNFPMMNPYFPHLHHALPTFQNELQAPSVNQIARNNIANQSLPRTMQNPQINPFVRTSSINQLLSLQHGLQQQQANQITENKCVSQQLHLQSPMQSIQEYQSVKNSPTVLNAFQPVQQHVLHQSAENNYSSSQAPNAVQEFAKLHAAIFNLNSQLASLQNVWNQSQSK